ncbi:MAG: hypothetical protein GY750_13475 [Lentisphaerae bacterium]|nr:hypothetical protein [Lentisphaerota bacterium]MCP4102414.1 hypothetical protein [Lentisphaerota bacterium]
MPTDYVAKIRLVNAISFIDLLTQCREIFETYKIERKSFLNSSSNKKGLGWRGEAFKSLTFRPAATRINVNTIIAINDEIDKILLENDNRNFIKFKLILLEAMRKEVSKLTTFGKGKAMVEAAIVKISNWQQLASASVSSNLTDSNSLNASSVNINTVLLTSATNLDSIFEKYSIMEASLHQPYFIMSNKLKAPWPAPVTEGKRVIFNKKGKYRTSFLLNCACVIIWEAEGHSVLFYHLSHSALTSSEYSMVKASQVYTNASSARVVIVSSMDSYNLEYSVDSDLLAPLEKCGFKKQNIVVFSNYSGYLGIDNCELGMAQI